MAAVSGNYINWNGSPDSVGLIDRSACRYRWTEEGESVRRSSTSLRLATGG